MVNTGSQLDDSHQYSFSGSGSNDDNFCVPVKNSTISIPGPNGEHAAKD